MGDNKQPSADSPPRSDRERRHQGREVLSLVQDNTRLAAEILDQQSLNQRLSQQLTELQASQQAADQRGTVLEKERAILQHQLDHLQQETEQRAALQRQQLQAANAGNRTSGSCSSNKHGYREPVNYGLFDDQSIGGR